MRYFAIQNWGEFQHYSKRLPPWIKLHNSLLKNYKFSGLKDAEKAHLMLIWLLASQNDNRLPYDPVWVRHHIDCKGRVDLDKLLALDYIEMLQPDSTVLADRKQVATLGREETETETEVGREAALEEKITGSNNHLPPSPQPDECLDNAHDEVARRLKTRKPGEWEKNLKLEQEAKRIARTPPSQPIPSDKATVLSAFNALPAHSRKEFEAYYKQDHPNQEPRWKAMKIWFQRNMKDNQEQWR